VGSKYMEQRKIRHLLYVDDLKLTGRSEEELKNEMRIINTISNDIKMESGLKNVPESL